MTIYRGPGGGGNADSDAEINALTALTNQALAYSEAAGLEADAAALSAAAASTSAASAATSASGAATSATNAASSASSASTSASSASTSATNAAASASTASTSATNAASSASAASTSATNAATSETNAATSAASALTYSTASAASAVTASTQAGLAATSASAAAGSATTASTQASNAATSASSASTSATNAASSASAASASAAAALASETAAAASVASIDLPTIVRTTGDQTIGGIKTFSSTIVGSVNGNAATATTATNQSGGTVSATSVAYSTTLTGGTGIINIGSGQVYKDASGNVGLATSSPRVRLDVRSDAVIAAPTPLANAVASGVLAIGDSVGSVVGLQLNGSSYDTYIQSRNMGAGSTAYNLLLQPLGGNVGIGTSSPSQKLDVNGNIVTDSYSLGAGNGIFFRKGFETTAQPSITVEDHSGSAPDGLSVNGADGVSFKTGNTERARIDSSGNLLVGTTTSSGFGTKNFELNAGAGGGAYILVTGSSNTVRGEFAVDGAAMYIGAKTNHPVNFRTNDAIRMTIAASGAVSVSGALSKGSGSFRIDHPLPALSKTHQLVHSFIEGPQADNIYRGKVTLVGGAATVNIDASSGMTEGTFVALNREVQCFTTNETGWVHVRGKVTGNLLTIEAQDTTCTDTISWMVIGERQDKHMYDTEWTDKDGKVIVEPLKDQPELEGASDATQGVSA